jgi:hypothetical protein
MASRRGPDGTVRIAIQGTHNGTNWANVFWANLAGGAAAPQANLDTWVDAFANAYKARFGNLQTGQVAFVQAKATLFQTGGTVLQSVRAMTGTGANGSAELTENAAAAVVSWLSPVYWRGGKPRTYLAGITLANTTGAKALTAGAISAYALAGTNFRADVNALVAGAITSTTLGFVSFRSGNADRVPPVFFSITGATAHTRLGTQRRRLGKWTL